MSKVSGHYFHRMKYLDLHDKFGLEFEQAYLGYEQLAAAGKIRVSKKVPAPTIMAQNLNYAFLKLDIHGLRLRIRVIFVHHSNMLG